MRVQLDDNGLTVTREDGDIRFSGVQNGAGESRLLHHVKLALNAQGFDFIKKRMWKDGHMMDDLQQYLRERNATDGMQLAIYNGRWQIEGAEEILNRTGSVRFIVANIGVRI